MSGSFSVDEKITQSSTGAVGKVIEWDSTNAILYFVQSRHSNEGVDANGNQVAFQVQVKLVTEGGTHGTPDTTHSATTNNVVFNSGYSVLNEHDSGDVLYVENRALALQEQQAQTENIKLIIEFLRGITDWLQSKLILSLSYFDDFNESKKFHRILFRLAFVVQARELTQSQSILQKAD